MARHTSWRVVGRQRPVVDERTPGRAEVILAFGRRGVQEKRRRLDRKVHGGLQQCLLGPIELVVPQQCPAEEREGRARGRRPGSDSFERLERFVEGRAIVPRLRILQPDPSQRLVDDGLIRRPLEGCTKGDDGGLRVAGTCLSQPHRDLALDVVAIQTGEDLKLIELVGAPVLRRIEIGQFFARGHETRRECHGLFERALRLEGPPAVAQAKAQEVVRFGVALAQAHRLERRGERRVDLAGPVARQGHFIAHARGSVVQGERALVRFSGQPISLHLVLHVAEALKGPGRAGVERRGLTEIVGRRFEIAAAQIGFTAPEPGDHRVGTKGDGPAIGLDRTERLVVGQGGVASGQEPLVVRFPAQGLVRDDRPKDGNRQDDQKGEESAHSGVVFPNMVSELPGPSGV